LRKGSQSVHSVSGIAIASIIPGKPAPVPISSRLFCSGRKVKGYIESYICSSIASYVLAPVKLCTLFQPSTWL